MHPSLFARFDHLLDQVGAEQLAHDAFVVVPYYLLTPIVSDHPPSSSASGHLKVDPLNGKDGDYADQDDRDGYVWERHDRHGWFVGFAEYGG